MLNDYYKVFFKIIFIYEMSKRKFSKSFKSDLYINNILLKCSLNDTNVHKKWNKFVMKSSVNELNLLQNLKILSLVKEKLLLTE